MRMTPIFGVDITSDKHNETINGSEFITRTASKAKLEEYESKQEGLEQTLEKSRIPLWLQIVKALSGLYFLIVLAATAKAGFEKALQNAPGLLISAAVCGLLWLILQVVSKGKEKKVLKDEDAEQQTKELHADFASIHEELEVPGDAVDVDILAFRYKQKNGEIRPHASGLQTTPYVNVNVKMYATADEVCLADLESVYTIPKFEIRGITTVGKRISVPSWNKDEDPRSGVYKPYKMTVSNMGDVFFKPYHILEICHEGQTFGLYFPCYELETVEKITGVRAERA